MVSSTNPLQPFFGMLGELWEKGVSARGARRRPISLRAGGQAGLWTCMATLDHGCVKACVRAPKEPGDVPELEVIIEPWAGKGPARNVTVFKGPVPQNEDALRLSLRRQGL